MAEPNYRLDTWSGLDHYICLVPGDGGGLHGWDGMSLDAMTTHLRRRMAWRLNRKRRNRSWQLSGHQILDTKKAGKNTKSFPALKQRNLTQPISA